MRFVVLLLLVLVSACGKLPHPFEGNPGATARKLATPPETRLFVDKISPEFLPADRADLFSTALADALAAQDVPAISEGGRPGDWHVSTALKRDGAMLLPLFTLFDEKGEQAGIAQGQPVSPLLWKKAAVETMLTVSSEAAPAIASLLTHIEAARQAADPNSPLNRGVRIYVPRVTGAPGDGNDALAKQMKTALVEQSLQVSPESGDFTVAGQVVVVKLPAGMERVEIQWIVSDARGERGRIVQLNEIKAGLLDRFWGDVAVVVAEEAAAGVKDLVARLVGSSSK